MSRVLWVLVLSGCAYKVTLTALPSPAVVQLPGNQGVVVTPADVVFRWVPLGSQKILVSADGYRPVEVDLRDREIRGSRYLTDALFRPATFFGRPRGQVHLVLVPEHGPMGTWDPDDVP